MTMKTFTATALATLFVIAGSASDGNLTPIAEPLDALLVVQNHVSDDFQKPLTDIGDRIAAALSGDIFSVIDPNDSFGDNLNRSPWGEGMPATSITRLAESLGAKALITASIGEASVVGIGSPMVAQTVKMTLTISAKRLPNGANLAAVSVTEKSPNMPPEVLEQSADGVYSDLVGKLVAKASAQILEKVKDSMRPFKDSEPITVFFGCNVLGADVEMDGLSIGICPGQFSVTPGVHAVRVSYPPYYYDFNKQARLVENGQTLPIVLQINPEGENQRLAALDYEKKHDELKLWRRERELDIEAKGIDVERKRRELDFEFEKQRKQLERELAEGSELFKKQLELADAMLKRYELSGETDDYVRKAIADGTSIYWQNSYGQIVITDGDAESIGMASPSTSSGDLTASISNRVDIAESLQKMLMRKPDGEQPQDKKSTDKQQNGGKQDDKQLEDK